MEEGNEAVDRALVICSEAVPTLQGWRVCVSRRRHDFGPWMTVAGLFAVYGVLFTLVEEYRMHMGVLVAIAVLVLFVLEWNVVVEEDCVFIRGVGVTIGSRRRNGVHETQFWPGSDVHQIIIHEAMNGFRVDVFLALIVPKSGGLVMLFPSFCKSLNLHAMKSILDKCKPIVDDF